MGQPSAYCLGKTVPWVGDSYNQNLLNYQMKAKREINRDIKKDPKVPTPEQTDYLLLLAPWFYSKDTSKGPVKVWS
jgi:hypothetical protein